MPSPLSHATSLIELWRTSAMNTPGWDHSSGSGSRVAAKSVGEGLR
jgi:hypothetical protein